MDLQGQANPAAVVERWVCAMNDHDLEAAISCFDPDYQDEAPARRGESIRGREKVRENFSALFRTIPDLQAELLGSVDDGEEKVWMEWRMQGNRSDGTRMEFMGVNIFGVRGERIVWGRIYSELVRDAGNIDAQIGRMTGGS